MFDVGRSAFWLTAWPIVLRLLPASPFFPRVARIASCLSRFFHPCRQQLQIEKIDSLDGGRCHRFHLLEWQMEANVKNLARRRSIASTLAEEERTEVRGLELHVSETVVLDRPSPSLSLGRERRPVPARDIQPT